MTETTPSTGRDTFRRFRLVIRFVTRALGLLPARARVFIWNRVEAWQGIVGIGLRYCLLRTLARSCGTNVLIGPGVEIRGWSGLSIGDNVSVHRACYVDAQGGITIGSNVSIAHATSLLSFEHGWEDVRVPIKYNPLRLAPVVIEDDVWVGCGCRILAGVRIETRTIVAAGAVVTKNVPRGSVVGGIPARVLKSIEVEACVGPRTSAK